MIRDVKLDIDTGLNFSMHDTVVSDAKIYIVNKKNQKIKLI